MTPEQLKASILQYAIQGKLVEQRPEEGTGEELYRQIQAEKQLLIKEGKIKKEKPFSQNPAYQDYPFDIPDTWIFVRFGELLITRDSERIPVSVSDRNKRAKIYDYYGASGVIDKIDDFLFDKELLLIGEDGANLLSRSTPIAFIAKGKYWVNNHAHILDACCNLNLDYVCYYINAISLAPYVTGTAQPKMNQENMNAIWIALPPLAEQKRIVAKVEELLPYVDRYAAAYEKLEQFNAKFPEDMKKSILQYAIQGKLVEQRPEEGTGEELYQQIQADCQQEESQSKRRSKKTTSVTIAEQDPPFDIPETWKWVKLGQLGYTNIGLTYSPKDICEDGIVVLRSSNIQNGKMDYDDIVKVSCPIPDNKMCHIGDILICARNGSKRLVGKAALIDQESMSFGAFMAIFRSVCNPYILHVINSAYFRNTLLGDTGTTTINQITQDMLKNVLIPLPPLAEQKRIVAKLEEILPLCERLK